MDEETRAGHGRPPSQPLNVVAPPAHAGLVRALNNCFGRAPALPEDFRRLLDRLR